LNTEVPDALSGGIALELDQAAMRMARALEAFDAMDRVASEGDQVASGGKQPRCAVLLRDLAVALDDYLFQMHRSMGIGEHALDTVYYFGTPSLDQLGR
jgi:hypothetical protein